MKRSIGPLIALALAALFGVIVGINRETLMRIGVLLSESTMKYFVYAGVGVLVALLFFNFWRNRSRL